jgi:hypothetical protein
LHGLQYVQEEPSGDTCLANVKLEPAHAQIAANRAAYILLKLIKDGDIGDNEALLNFSYDLIELASEQGMFDLNLSLFSGLTCNLQPKVLNSPPMEPSYF